MGAFVEGLAWEGSVSENVCRRTRVAWRQDRHPASRPPAPAPRSCQVTSVSVQAGGAHVNALAWSGGSSGSCTRSLRRPVLGAQAGPGPGPHSPPPAHATG